VFLPVGDKGALCPCQMTDIQGDFLFWSSSYGK
jgi:hypothetical protein